MFDPRLKQAVGARDGGMCRPLHTVTFMIAVFCVSTIAAQGHGGGGSGGMGSPGMSHNPFGGNSSTNSRSLPPPGSQSHENGAVDSTMHGGLQLGPPGRWWDDKAFARSVGLDSDQQHRMDDVFSANKGNLIKLYKNLQHEESQLGKMVHGKELVESQIFEQIDHVAQARGELEKANAHMLLEIRRQMTPEQTAKLDDHLSSQ